MKKYVTLLLAGVLTAACLLSGCGKKEEKFAYLDTEHDFMDCDFGFSREEVKNAETHTLSKDMSSMLVYKDVELDGYNTNIVYSYEKDGDELLEGMVFYEVEDSEALYDELYDKLVELYGPYSMKIDENFTWVIDDKTYELIKLPNGKVVYSAMSKEYAESFRE